MHLTQDVLRLLDESVLCWLATSSADGRPNVSPKELFAPHRDSVVIANVASPKSLRNVRENPHACVAFVNIFTQKGFQLSGMARVVTPSDDGYDEIHAVLYRLAGDDFPFKAIFQITPETVTEIIAPRYRLFPETTEAEQIASAMATYGVRPREES